VRAADAIGNLSGYGAAVTATVTAPVDTQPPTAPTGLTANADANGHVLLSWTASTDDVGVTGYRIERCEGNGCSTFAQVATATGTTYSDATAQGQRTYNYRVRAVDAVPRFSNYSNTASVSTPQWSDTHAPTVPGGFSAASVSSSQIDLTWSASTDDFAVSGYSVERCTGSSCSNFSQVATPTATSFNDIGLSSATTYRYRVRARDAVPNYSGYSAIRFATTSAGADSGPPTAPASSSATAASTSQIEVTWGASTDDVGVTSYLVERCQGASCSTFVQVATVSFARYSDSGLTGGATYRYRIRALDAAANISTYSPVATAATVTGTGKAGSVTYEYDSFGRIKQVTVAPQ
jgi:fibronectin type 3 domain-containing protein